MVLSEVSIIPGDCLVKESDLPAPEVVELIAEYGPILQNIEGWLYIIAAFWIPLIVIVGAGWWFFKQFIYQ